MHLHRNPWSSRQASALTDHVNRTSTRQQRLVGTLTALFIGVVLTGAYLRATADTYEAVYLYNSSGTPVLCTTDVYTEGHIFQLSPNAEIGTVSSDGHIVSDATGQTIGLIDPSQAGIHELGH